MKLRYFVLAIVVLSFMPRDAHSAAFHVPSFGQALRGSVPSIPAAWAGIWTFRDTTHTCADPNTITGTDSGLDTLCTGQVFQDSTGGVQVNCTGTVTDNSADVTCTGSFQFFPGCDVQFTNHLVATRNGNQAFVTTTFNTVYTPSMCLLQLDSCDVTESTLARIAGEPTSCMTPVQRSTWGAVKVHYR